MSSLTTVRLVAEREVRQRLRSKLFVITSIGLAVIVSVAAALPALLGVFDDDPDEVTVTADPDPSVVVVVGELSEPEREALVTTVGPIEERQVADVEAAEQAVTDDDEDVAFAVVPGERLLTAPSGSILNFGADPAYPAAEALALADVLAASGATDDVAAALQVTPLEVELVGDEDPAEATARLIAANLGVVFLFAVLIMYASMIINGVIEEKGSRVVELLVAAVPVRQLMAGKVIGLGLIGIGQTLMIFGPPAIVLSVTARDVIPVGVGGLAAVIVLWFALGYAFYAVLAAGLGSLVSRPEEAQAVLTPANTMMVVGYFIGFSVINAPDSTFATVFGWLPPTAPYVMVVRQAIGSPTLVEVLGSIVLMLVAIVGATLLAARLYRGGILKVGARVKITDAWRSAEG